MKFTVDWRRSRASGPWGGCWSLYLGWLYAGNFPRATKGSGCSESGYDTHGMGQSLIQLACDGLHKLNYREVNSNMAVMYSKHIESLENIIIYCHCSATETSNARMLPSSFASHVTQRHFNVSWWKNTGFCACKLYCSVCTEQRMRERIHCPAVKKSFMLMHFL